LVRHAKAGTRKDWDGDDRTRPLTRPGWAQARALVDVLAPYGPTRLLSSPYVRCVQSFDPLGEALGLEVESADELAEGRSGKAIVLVRSFVAGPTVAMSTHGDIVPSVLEALVEEDGMKLSGPSAWPKGSTWVLHAKKGRYVRADYLPPPV
jgi:8-oxo-dGTP diphosphatase